MRLLTAIAVSCLVVAGVARAELIDHTGKDYGWVSYNNLTDGTHWIPETVPTNVTNFSYDGDYPAEDNPTGLMVRYSNGAPVGVTVDISFNEIGQLFVDQAGYFGPAGAIFADVMDTGGGTSSYEGCVVLHGDDPQTISTQTLTFSGLDPNQLYTFAGIGVFVNSAYFNGLSSVEILGVDASIDENVLSALIPTNFPVFVGQETATKTFLTYDSDDLVLWSGINPGDDGTFQVVTTHTVTGNRGWSPGLDAIALGVEVPEPATMGLLVLGGVVSLWRRRS